jgi:tripartite-type tricarboxylate transporter receptor subunit TctC
LAAVAKDKENITIVYAFAATGSQANYFRSLIKEANAIQDKYNFLFDTKNGAGGALAAKYVLTTPNTILGTSGAFFIRPNFFPNESYQINDYQPLLPMCSSPITVTSVKYKNWASVPKDQPTTIGIAGLGTATHLVALELKKVYPNLEVIPYKSTPEGLTNLLGGIIDFNTNFLSEAEQHSNITVLGTTGKVRQAKHPILIEQKFSADLANMDNPQHLIVPANLDPVKFAEYRDIFYRASKLKSVRAIHISDHCNPLEVNDNDLALWYNKQNVYWSRLSSKVEKNNLNF